MAREEWMQDHAAKRIELQAACLHPELGVTGEGAAQSRYRCVVCQWEGSAYELVSGRSELVIPSDEGIPHAH